MITQAELKAVLRYEPETGNFYWINCGKQEFNGLLAGTIQPPTRNELHGSYRKILIRSKSFSAHRLAWLYVSGSFPNGEIDHINGNSLDNRIENLRLCTHAENRRNSKLARNNTSGFKNVSYNKSNRRWVVGFTVNKVKHHYGCFDSALEAAQRAKEVRSELHGEFANHG